MRHADLLVWDNHVCLPLRPDEACVDWLERHRAAGATFVSVNIGDAEVALARMLQVAACFRASVEARPDRFVLASTAADVRRAKTENRLAVAFDVEGARALADDLTLVPRLYSLGVRWMLIAYNRANLVGSGCHDDHDAGLTPFGRRFLQELDRVGMVICCSHTGYRTARDVLEHATKPVTFVEPEALPALTDLLLARGYSDDDVRAIMGGNFLRVAEEVWGAG